MYIYIRNLYIYICSMNKDINIYRERERDKERENVCVYIYIEMYINTWISKVCKYGTLSQKTGSTPFCWAFGGPGVDLLEIIQRPQPRKDTKWGGATEKKHSKKAGSQAKY